MNTYEVTNGVAVFSQPVYRFAGFELDIARRVVTRANHHPIKINGKAFDTLVYLVQHAGEPVERKALIEHLWPTTIVEDNNLNQTITALRRALGNEHITTLAGRGYQFVTPVIVKKQGLENRTPQLVNERDGTFHSFSRTIAAAPGSRRAMLLFGVLTVLFAGLLLITQMDSGGAGASDGAPVGYGLTIAVLPFSNISPDPGQEYFADGLSIELMNQLSRIEQMRVTARNSAFVFKDRNATVGDIGRQLGVAYVLEGSVRRDGDQIRISAQLIDTASGFQQWSETYESDVRELFAIQDAIAAQVASELMLTFGLDRASANDGGTTNVEAYDHYLQGQQVMRGAWVFTWQEALNHLERAIALDPDFYLARVALADAYRQLIAIRPQYRAQADAAVIWLLENAPAEADTQLLLAQQYRDAWKLQEAELAFRRALAKAANDSKVNLQYGTFLLQTGRAQAALAYLQKAREVDPLMMEPEHQLAVAWDMLGDPVEAHGHYQATLTLEGPRPLPAIQELYRLVVAGKQQEARAVHDSLNLTNVRTLFASSINLLNDAESGRSNVLKMATDPTLTDLGGKMSLGHWAAWFGDAPLAVEMLRQSSESNLIIFLTVWSPMWDKVRASPEFKAFIAETSLVDYWRRFGWPEHCQPKGDADFECR